MCDSKTIDDKYARVVITDEHCYECGRSDYRFDVEGPHRRAFPSGRAFEVPREMLELWLEAERIRDEIGDALNDELEQAYRSPAGGRILAKIPLCQPLKNFSNLGALGATMQERGGVVPLITAWGARCEYFS